jgi:fatty acid desaturase
VAALSSFEDLRREVEQAGCFQRRPIVAITSLVAHVAASGALFLVSATAENALAATVCFVVASFLFYRLGWLMHDAAHGGVFETASGNRRFAAITAAILGEFPSGWRYGHNRHHATPNVRGRDLDQSERWDPERRYRTRAGAFVGVLLFSKFRGRYLPKTLLLLGLRDGYFCYRFHRDAFARELIGSLAGLGGQLVFMCVLFGVWGPLLFLAHTSIGMVYLNTAFAGNHYDLESFDEAQADGIPFEDLQARTTRNYRGGALARFVFGGLENQLEHHLFPGMPRAGLRKAAPFVRAFCAARGLPYHEASFSSAVAGVLRFHLKRGNAS